MLVVPIEWPWQFLYHPPKLEVNLWLRFWDIVDWTGGKKMVSREVTFTEVCWGRGKVLALTLGSVGFHLKILGLP